MQYLRKYMVYFRLKRQVPVLALKNLPADVGRVLAVRWRPCFVNLYSCKEELRSLRLPPSDTTETLACTTVSITKVLWGKHSTDGLVFVTNISARLMVTDNSYCEGLDYLCRGPGKAALFLLICFLLKWQAELDA